MNPFSSSHKAIIFWARGSLICKILVSSSRDAELIFIILSSGFEGVGEVDKKSTLALLNNSLVLSGLYLLVHKVTNCLWYLRITPSSSIIKNFLFLKLLMK